MRDEWTEEDVRRYCKKNGLPLPAGVSDKPELPQAGEKKPNKYRNEKTTVDGELFDSKREAQRWEQHKQLIKAGQELAVARQVVFLLPGGVKYIADFVILLSDGRYVVEDAKGVRTEVYRLKKRLMRECLGIEIVEV